MEPLTLAFVLLLVALGLAVLDLFIPSHGMLSLMGAAALVGAVAVGFSQGVRQGMMIMAIVGFSLPLLLLAIIKWWPRTPIGRLIILKQPGDPDEVLPEEDSAIEAIVGSIGRARSDMLPGGAVVIGNRSWDAVSEGRPIDAGTPVKVVAVRMGRLVVRPASAEDLAQATEAESSTLLDQPLDDWDLEED